jgi:hypothetical protein
MRESYTAIVVRIDEALKNLKESNFEEHKELKESFRDLKAHVNDELVKFDFRVKILEDDNLLKVYVGS